MRYKEFGSTGMKVSEIALGTWGMGGVGWDQYDEATRIEAIHTAIDCGINFIDTAPAYNNGAAEQLLGKALAQGGLRDKAERDRILQDIREGRFDNHRALYL